MVVSRIGPGGTTGIPRDSDLHVRLGRHAPADAKEAGDLAEILAFVDRYPDPFDRRISEGHLTGSAVVVSAEGDRVLLLHHRKLGRWLQPGGHAEPGEREGAAIALREACEETGIAGLALHPSAPRPFDVDVHPIPARGDEPAHRHLDLRYLVIAPPDSRARRQAVEARALRWFTWEEVTALDLDPGLRRALRAARAFTSDTPCAREDSDR
ncbi:MAG TPA: NUDIX hydrolase [Methylomirabilota bacterium]|nr:NUDIX hydrolase [Methylomirabilota bacterium]